MYSTVRIEDALHGVPMGPGVQLGLGEGPIKSGSSPNLARTIGPVSHTLVHTCTLCVISVLLWAVQGDLFPHIGGAVSHQAHMDKCAVLFHSQ